jgi:endonuclease/exonuclease/phosphatase family metal-dependent hydrolase
MSKTPPAENQSKPPGMWSWIGTQLLFLSAVLWLNGTLLRLTVRDGNDLLAPIFYATPWPVLAVLTLPVMWFFRRNPKAIFGLIVIAHLFGGAWIMHQWKPRREKPPEPGELRVFQWNVASPTRSFAAIAKRVREANADIIALNEAAIRVRKKLPLEEIEKQLDTALERWRGEFADYAYLRSTNHGLVLIRGEVNSHQKHDLGVHSGCMVVEVRHQERDFRVLHADIVSRPNLSRREPLRRLTEIALSLNDRPLILVGDFNTPCDSVHLLELRKAFRNAFEVAGQGSIDTWPAYFPVLALDQVWTSAGLRAVDCQHGIAFRSDHRPVTADLRFE